MLNKSTDFIAKIGAQLASDGKPVRADSFSLSAMTTATFQPISNEALTMGLVRFGAWNNKIHLAYV